MTACRVASSRSGLTLLELLISMVLMAFVLGITWALLGVFRDRFENSQRQAEQWQLIRSLQQVLADDLRSCHISVASTSSPHVDGDTGAVVEQPLPTTASVSDVIVQSQWLDTESVLLGTSRALMFDFVPPAAHQDAAPLEREPPLEQVLIPDTLRRVIYVFHDAETAARLDRPPGLIRCELTLRELILPRELGTNGLDLLTQLEQEPPEHMDYVPELATFLLRYYDGSSWRENWDSRLAGQLPVAIELRFQLVAELPGAATTDENAEPAAPQRSGDVLDASRSSPRASLPTELEPMDDRLRSAQTRPPNDHRFLIFLHPGSKAGGLNNATAPTAVAFGPAAGERSVSEFRP